MGREAQRHSTSALRRKGEHRQRDRTRDTHFSRIASGNSLTVSKDGIHHLYPQCPILHMLMRAFKHQVRAAKVMLHLPNHQDAQRAKSSSIQPDALDALAMR